VLVKREFDTNDFLYRFWTAITGVTALFSFIVFVLLMINYLQIRSADPVNHELMTQMRQDYAALPEQDQVLAERIQTLDLLTRKAFFTSQTHLRIGGFLLLAGVCGFLIAFKYMVRWQREKPELKETPTADLEFSAFAQSRQLITWASVGVLAVGLALTVLTQSLLSKLPESETAATAGANGESGAEIAFAIPTWEDLEQNWPSFRGPVSNGTAGSVDGPTEWDVEAGTNIKWTVDLPLPGANSPVIWGDRLFLSAADASAYEVHCYDVETGEQIWKQTVGQLPGSPADKPEVTEETGHAAPTMVVHGELVFAVFANGDMVAYDFEGELVWGRNVGVPENHYGHSSSLIAWDGLVYVQLDGMSEAKVLALNIGTGDEVWSAQRETISWASPIIARTEIGPQLIMNSEATVDAYDPATGKLLWSEEFLAGEVAPSPVYANGIVFAANEYAVAGAIRVGGTAEAPESELIWEYDEFLPEVASPITDGERIYFGTSAGDFVCVNLESASDEGEEVYAEELDMGFYSSPVLVGDTIYIGDLDGVMYVIKSGPEFELISKIEMGEEIFATPAFMDGRMYLRTAQHLYCIEQE